MNTENFIENELREKEVIFNRIFDAPINLVWEAWTTPEHLAQWWGPTGFTLTTYEMEVKPGSVWRFMMHGPDGTDFPNKVQYLEVDKPKRLVYRHVDDDGSMDVAFTVTVTMEALGDQTKLQMHMVFDSAEKLKMVVEQYGAYEGGQQTLARLKALLEKLRW